MDSVLFISDIFKQKHWLLVKVELVFINTFKDHVNSSDASLRQYIFLQIGVYSVQKYPLQAWQYEIECINVWFVFKYLIADWMNSYKQRTLIGRAERIKPKQIKWIMTCVSLNGLSEFNTQYFFMGMVRFESQEYTLQGRMQFFAKLDKIRLF